MKETDNLKGPVEDLKWATRLKAHVVTPGSRPRIHGYDVRGELMEHLTLSELMLLTLTGELPGKNASLAFERVMIFLAPVSVAEAPVHASVLAGLCGSGSSGMTGVAALTLAEQARAAVEENRPLFEWLREGAGGDSPLPPSGREEREETGLLLSSLKRAGVETPSSWENLSPNAAALAVLHSCCGLTDPGTIEFFLVLTRMPCAIAEGKAVSPGGFRDYPIDLPVFTYRDEE